jgi:thiamine transport system permease protein
MTARRWVGWGLVAAVPLAFLGLFFVLPTGTLIARGFSTGGSLDLSGFGEVFSRPRTWRIVGLTFLQAALGTVFAVGLGIPGAYVLYRRRFRGQWLARALVTVPFVLPTVVVGVAFRSLLAEGGPLGALHLDGTLAAIVAALVFFNYSVVVRTVGGFWAHLDPRAEQAARVLGAPPWRAFLSVTLPALVPAITAAASIVFLFCATAFGVVLILGGIRFGTIETEIWIQTTQFLNLKAASVLSVVQLVVVGAVLGVSGAARRRRERALHLTAVDAARERLGRADWAPAVVTGLVGAVLIALPMLSLVLRSLQTSHGWSLQNYANLATTGGRGVLTGTVWAALGNSVRTAFVATAIAVVVGALVALVVSRRPHSRSGRRAIETLDAVFMLPLGVSAVTVGFGFLIALHRPLGLDIDLRTWWGLVPVAQAVVAVPLVVRSLLPVLRAIDPRLRQAGAVLGASPWRVFLAVDLPMVRRALGLAIGFAFAVSLGEFGATSFLVRPDRPTLPIVIYRLIGRPGAENLGMALAASVVLAALTAAVMMLAERWRPASAMGEL